MEIIAERENSESHLYQFGSHWIRRPSGREERKRDGVHPLRLIIILNLIAKLSLNSQSAVYKRDLQPGVNAPNLR